MKIQLALSLFTLLAGIVTTKAYDIDIDEIASQIRRDEAAAAQKDPRVGGDPTESEYVTVYKKSDEPKSAATAETAQQKRELKEADRQFEAAYRSMSLDSQNALNS